MVEDVDCTDLLAGDGAVGWWRAAVELTSSGFGVR